MLHYNILVVLKQIIEQLAVTLPLKIFLLEVQRLIGNSIGFGNMYFIDIVIDQYFNRINYNHSLFAQCFQNKSFNSKIIRKGEVYIIL